MALELGVWMMIGASGCSADHRSPMVVRTCAEAVQALEERHATTCFTSCMTGIPCEGDLGGCVAPPGGCAAPTVSCWAGEVLLYSPDGRLVWACQAAGRDASVSTDGSNGADARSSDL